MVGTLAIFGVLASFALLVWNQHLLKRLKVQDENYSDRLWEQGKLVRTARMEASTRVDPCGEIDPHGSELCWMRRGHGGPHRAQSGLAFATEHRKHLAASKVQTPPESNLGGVEMASPEMRQPSEGAI